MDSKPLRNSKGHLLPGQGSLNPGGRPRGLERLVRETLQDDWEKMMFVMRDIVYGRLPEGLNAVTEIKPRDRIEALKLLCDRAWGKARTTVDLTHDSAPTGFAGVDVDELDDETFAALEKVMDQVLFGRKLIDANGEEK